MSLVRSGSDMQEILWLGRMKFKLLNLRFFCLLLYSWKNKSVCARVCVCVCAVFRLKLKCSFFILKYIYTYIHMNILVRLQITYMSILIWDIRSHIIMLTSLVKYLLWFTRMSYFIIPRFKKVFLTSLLLCHECINDQVIIIPKYQHHMLL